MDVPEFFSILTKIIIATAAYFAVLGVGLLASWWMARRAGHQEGKSHE